MRKILFSLSLCLFTACQPQQEVSEGLDLPSKSYPQRVITLSPHLTELVYSLGAEDKLVATVEYSDFPKAAESLPRIGNAFQLDWEALTALKPDLIIAWEGGNPETILTKLEQQGFKVLRLENAGLIDLPIQLEGLSQVLTGHSTVSRGSDYLKGLERLRKEFSNKERVNVFYQISAEPIYTVNNKHTISDMLELCGGTNVFESLGKISAPVTPEAVVGMKPDVILTTTFTHDDVASLWSGVFQAEDIISVPADEVTRASLRMLQGTKNICEALDEWRQRDKYKALVQKYIDVTREAAAKESKGKLTELNTQFLANEFDGEKLVSIHIWNYESRKENKLIYSYISQVYKSEAVTKPLIKIANEINIREYDKNILALYFERKPNQSLGRLSYKLVFEK